MKIVALCGGVGGSKLVLGLKLEFPEDELAVVVNTADDVEIFGLHVSPDLDTVMYTLAGVSNDAFGWGLEGDSFECLSMLERYGKDAWFRVGDRDVATHILRTSALRNGERLTNVTRDLARRLDVRAVILPMTDQKVRTRVLSADGWLEFQEYFVKRHHADRPLDVVHVGIGESRVTEEVKRALATADVVIAAPSNPIVSLGPILSVPGMVDALCATSARKLAISPVIGNQSVTGPADALMQAKGYSPTVEGIAQLYKQWLNVLVIDEKDRGLSSRVEAQGVEVVTADTIMSDVDSKRRLARFAVATAT